jgi:peptide-methionine (R)-S-oxide reductase
MQQNPSLTDEQRNILFNKHTEAPFTGALLHNDKTGVYSCANCGSSLFMSDTKFDSGSGWPSFYKPKQSDAVDLIKDDSHGMKRTEVVCRNCGGHLGHVFDDGPTTLPDGKHATGQRFCINSASLCFEEKADLGS